MTRWGAGSPAYASEVFGPVAPVIRFSNLDEAAALASGQRAYGLSLGTSQRDVVAGLGARESDPERHGAHQRPDRRRRTQRSVRWPRSIRQRFAVRRRVEPRSVHRHAVGHRQEPDSRIPMMAVSAGDTAIASRGSSRRRPPGRAVARTGRNRRPEIDSQQRRPRPALSAERSSLPQKEPS